MFYFCRLHSPYPQTTKPLTPQLPTQAPNQNPKEPRDLILPLAPTGDSVNILQYCRSLLFLFSSSGIKINDHEERTNKWVLEDIYFFPPSI